MNYHVQISLTNFNCSISNCEKIKIFYKSFQKILFKTKDSDNIYEVIYCLEDDEYRVHSEICEKLCFERFYKNILKSGTHTNNFYKRQVVSNTNKSF